MLDPFERRIKNMGNQSKQFTDYNLKSTICDFFDSLKVKLAKIRKLQKHPNGKASYFLRI